MWFSAVVNWVFPKICCFCEEVSELSKNICDCCYRTLPWAEQLCYRCGARLEGENEHILCERCQEKPLSFDRLCTLFHYQPPIKKLITRLKFSGQLAYGRILGEILAEHFSIWYKKDNVPQAIVPVPLSLERLRQRGYNQCLELLRPLSRAYPSLPLISPCKRIRHTIPQSDLNKEKRNRNLKGVFKVIDRKSLKNIEHVAIFDDVVTTGSTVKALTAVLKEQGISRVDILCCCRA